MVWMMNLYVSVFNQQVQNWANIGIRAWTCNRIQIKLWYVNDHPYPDLTSKEPLELGIGERLHLTYNYVVLLLSMS